MTDEEHLGRTDYREAAIGGLGDLAVRTQDHLAAVCPECGRGWEELGPVLRGVYREHLAALAPHPEPVEPHRDELSAAPAALASLAAQADELRVHDRRARQQLCELRALPAERRVAKVRGAYRRFRSRWLAELLIEESRKLVRSDPAEAESFAALVPEVLAWTRGADGPAWAPPLVARAAAHRANARRVGGDLPAADRGFARLAPLLAAPAVAADAGLLAEIASLEASLRIDQRRFAEAEGLLDRAALAYEYAGDAAGLARTWIQTANLMRTLGRPEEILELHERAARALGRGATPYLVVCTVVGRVNALCDLGLPEEARRLLRSHLDAFEADDEPHTAALLRCLEGRAALGLGELAEAEGYFASCHEGMLLAGRTYDAALAALYLAETYHAGGRHRELRRLAARLLPEFRSRDVARETLAVLQLLVRAVTAEELTAAVFTELRRKLLGVEPRAGAR
jgi:tetratricopeptide (TPR) repeat protein